MLGFFTLNCNTCADSETEIDYTSQLQAILTSSQDILREVQDHQVFASVDLTQEIAALTQLLGAMNYVAQRQDLTTEQIRAGAESLQKQFVELVKSIDGFNSSTLLAFTAFGNTFKAESDETQSILSALGVSIAEAGKIVEQKYYQYVLLAVAGGVEARISIPAGAIEIAAIPYTCYDYAVDTNPYTAGHQFLRESKAIGNRALVEDAHEIVIPAQAKLHLSYTALRPIGEPKIVGGTIVPSDNMAVPSMTTELNKASSANVSPADTSQPAAITEPINVVPEKAVVADISQPVTIVEPVAPVATEPDTISADTSQPVASTELNKASSDNVSPTDISQPIASAEPINAVPEKAVVADISQPVAIIEPIAPVATEPDTIPADTIQPVASTELNKASSDNVSPADISQPVASNESVPPVATESANVSPVDNASQPDSGDTLSY
jgi:hypothetical protein